MFTKKCLSVFNNKECKRIFFCKAYVLHLLWGNNEVHKQPHRKHIGALQYIVSKKYDNFGWLFI